MTAAQDQADREMAQVIMRESDRRAAVAPVTDLQAQLLNVRDLLSRHSGHPALQHINGLAQALAQVTAAVEAALKAIADSGHRG